MYLTGKIICTIQLLTLVDISNYIIYHKENNQFIAIGEKMKHYIYKKVLVVCAFSSFLLSELYIQENVIGLPSPKNQEPYITAEKNVSPECIVCDDSSFLSMYQGQNNVGIIDFNTGKIIPIEINRYNEQGNLVEMPVKSLATYTIKEENSCYTITESPGRGYANISIYYDNLYINEESSPSLCMNCFNISLENCWGDTPYCLGIINLGRKHIRLLEEDVSAFLLDDFYIDYNIQYPKSMEEPFKIDLLIFYCPERYR